MLYRDSGKRDLKKKKGKLENRWKNRTKEATYM